MSFGPFILPFWGKNDASWTAWEGPGEPGPLILPASAPLATLLSHVGALPATYPAFQNQL